MYTDFYRLTGRPFQLTPDPRFYFDTATHRKAMAYLSYGLAQGEGFIIITGDIGAGKTTLVGHLMETIDTSRLVAAKIVTTQLDAGGIAYMVASAFGVAVEGASKPEILTRLEARLRSLHAEGRRALLIVDEAQSLPIDALEELRMLSNFQEGTQALLQTFLLGQPEFRDKLANSNELEQLRQRVIATHHLEPMTQDEVPGYLVHRLKLCGWVGDPDFSDEAVDRMFRYSGGVPRRLNSLTTRLLLFGALEQLHEIGEDAVAEVIEDLRRDQAPGTPAAGDIPIIAATGDPELDVRIAGVERKVIRQERAFGQLLDLIGGDDTE